jgi:hypothetical protein
VNELRADRLERVKLSDIKDIPMDDPTTMRSINQLKNLARYDCK